MSDLLHIFGASSGLIYQHREGKKRTYKQTFSPHKDAQKLPNAHGRKKSRTSGGTEGHGKANCPPQQMDLESYCFLLLRVIDQFFACTVTRIKDNSKTIQWIESRNYDAIGNK